MPYPSSHVHSTPVVNPFVYKVASNSGYCSYQGCYSKGGRASLMVSNIGTPFPNAFCAVANSTFCRAKFRNSCTWSACWNSADRGCWIVGIDIISHPVTSSMFVQRISLKLTHWLWLTFSKVFEISKINKSYQELLGGVSNSMSCWGRGFKSHPVHFFLLW